MKPAVLMMFRDEADILGKCLEHWYALGVRDFYLCDNGSVDDSVEIAEDFRSNRQTWRHVFGISSDTATDWPGRRVINDLKNRALSGGCDWIFPADADEFLVLPRAKICRDGFAVLSAAQSQTGRAGLKYHTLTSYPMAAKNGRSHKESVLACSRQKRQSAWGTTSLKVSPNLQHWLSLRHWPITATTPSALTRNLNAKWKIT
ncbi:MAG: glycosyltransferase family 2 protein [Sphingobacteriales bacterium]|nr:glycosyltransferase family 2 protein [Sphingobacteriales bacterium]